MARYPMRSSWRAYRPAAQAAAGTCGRADVTGRFRRASSGSIPARLRTGFGVIDCAAGTLHHRRAGLHRHRRRPARRPAAHDPRAGRRAHRAASPAGNRRRTRVPLQERRQRAQAGPGARRGARGRAADARRARIRAARHQARGGGRGRRGESAGRAHGQATAARSRCELAADAADALAVAICHAHYRRIERLDEIA